MRELASNYNQGTPFEAKGRSSSAEAFQNFKLSASRGSPRIWNLVHESHPRAGVWALGNSLVTPQAQGIQVGGLPHAAPRLTP